MLRSKGLTDKLLMLGIDGMDPRFTSRMVKEGKMPNIKKLIESGSAREDLVLLGAIPTVTPPMWATLATGAYPMTHGIVDYAVSAPEDKNILISGFFTQYLKAEPLWNITAEAGKKTLVWHWPGGSFPPTELNRRMIENGSLMMVDGSSPGAVGGWYAKRGNNTIIIASANAEELNYAMFSIRVSDQVNVKEKLKFLPFSTKVVKTKENQDILKAHFEAFREQVEVDGYKADSGDVRSKIGYGDAEFGAGNDDCCGNMGTLADIPSDGCISPITEAKGWAFDVPKNAKEFTIMFPSGKIRRECLIVKNEDGKYDKVVMYKDKETEKPIVTLENDVFTSCVYDEFPSQNGPEKIIRNMRVLEIAEDGSYVRMWCSCGMTTEDGCVWYPHSLHKEITDKFGPMMPTSQMCGNDADLILKCNNQQWTLAAKWQANSLNYMIDEHDVEVIFSHYHGPDLQQHNYMKYMKNRETSRYDENEVVKFAEATYKLTDDYIGEFLHLLDKGWTIILFSDHAAICPEELPYEFGGNANVDATIFKKLGYTVMQTDENGNELPDIDWNKTTAIQSGENFIYLNLKGRDKYGIVNPEDKYALEEKIITDLYGVRDPKTGNRIVSFALHNKDAVLLGLGGPLCGDIVFCVHDDYCVDHGNGLATACGYNDTSLSPIFVAAGAGIKKGYTTEQWIREVDVAPTAAVLLGVEIPKQCEGAPAYSIFTETV